MRFVRLLTAFASIFERRYKKGSILKQRYQIVEELGMGSYGITYLANDLHEKRSVVIKQMRKAKQWTKNGKFSFQMEKAVLMSLNHPQIPKVIEVFTDKGVPHIAMEYIDGQTFEQLIFQEGKTYTEVETFELLKEILFIVKYIHQRGIVHRDLRIPNIIFRNGDVFIIDFGLARFLDDKEEEGDTEAIEMKLRRQIDVKSDFYALGHFALFLLYSAYEPETDEERSWEEELTLSAEARLILRKMLQIDEPFRDAAELIGAVDRLLQKYKNGGVHHVVV